MNSQPVIGQVVSETLIFSDEGKICILSIPSTPLARGTNLYLMDYPFSSLKKESSPSSTSCTSAATNLASSINI